MPRADVIPSEARDLPQTLTGDPLANTQDATTAPTPAPATSARTSAPSIDRRGIHVWCVSSATPQTAIAPTIARARAAEKRGRPGHLTER